MHDRVLHVHQPDHLQRFRELHRASPDPILLAMADDVGRNHRCRIAGVNAGFLDVLHHAGDDDVVTIGDRVDVELDRVFEEAIDEDRVSRCGFHGVPDVFAQRRFVIDDRHRATA